MKDYDIRQALLRGLRKTYQSDANILIIEELGLCQGKARIDIAVVNGFIHGYEIKSEYDTFARLPSQIEIYCRTLDAVTIVVSSRHLDKVKHYVPPWWGIAEAKDIKHGVEIFNHRSCKRNPDVDPTAMVQLLWKDEALAVLRKLNFHKGLLKKPRAKIWSQLVEKCTTSELRSFISQSLKSRDSWKFDLRRV